MSENSGEVTGFRDGKGRFVAGNPGKPVGARNKLPKLTLKRIEQMGDAAIEQLWRAVHRAEWQAIEFILRRILPEGRPIELADFSVADLKNAITDGDISPSEAKVLAAVLRDITEIESFDEIKTRLSELELALKDE